MKKKIYKPQNDTAHLDHSKTKITDKMNISILPHPTTIESYEEVVPGITKTFTTLFVKEQEHRHKMEQQAIKSMTTLSIVGQIITMILVIVIILFTISTILIFEDNQKNLNLAIVVSVCGFAFLSISSVMGARGIKKSLQKYEIGKNNNNSNKKKYYHKK